MTAHIFEPGRRALAASMSWAELIDNWAAFIKGAGWVFLPFLALPFVTLLKPDSRFLTRLSSGIIRTIDTIMFGIGEIVKWALPVLVLTVAFSVFAKEIFDTTWTKLFESAEYFHAIVIMLGAAATLLMNQHVRVDVFYTKMTAEQKSRVDLVGFYLLLMPVCLTLLWVSQDYTRQAWFVLEASARVDGIPYKFLLMSSISVFSFMMLAQGLSITLRAAKILNGQTMPERPNKVPPLFSEEVTE